MKYIIDCGTHFFQGLNQLNDIYDFYSRNDWMVYCFEPNPITFNKSIKYKPDSKNIIHYNAAVSTYNGYTNINCDFSQNIYENGCGQGSNILVNPPKKDIVYDYIFNFVSYATKVIDLSEFINSLDNIEQLIVKMDVEGEEYNIIPELIKSNTFTKISALYIEFHERFFVNNIDDYIRMKLEYISFLKDNNCKVILWE
jgi:FkbM family methyltransferase